MVYTIGAELFKPDTRHIRWIFTTRGGGSVNLGSIKLDKGTSVAKPQFSSEADTFFDAQTITLDCATPDAAIYYTFGSEQPTDASTRYTGPFEITATTTIRAIAYVGGEASYPTEKTYTRLYSEVTPESSAVAFSALNIFTLPVSETKIVRLTARNLRADLAVAISGNGFSCNRTTIPQSEAEAGAEVAVTYTPTLTDTYTGMLTFTAGGLDEPVVVALSGSTYVSEKQVATDEQFEILDGTSANTSVSAELAKIGWKAQNIFGHAGHKMRIGSSSNFGSLTSPDYDLSDPDYDYSVSFVAALYGSDKKPITVTLNGDAERTETLTLTATPEIYTYAIPHSKTASITLAGTEGDNRFHVNAVTIHKTPKKLELVIAGETTHQDINARLALESLTNITLTDAQITGEGSLNAPANPNCLIFSNRPMGFACNEVINGNCEHLKLTDHKPFGTSEAFTAAKATYIRNAYQDGYWESIMLPYNVAADQMPEGYVFDEFTGISDNAVTFTQVTELKAHTPYLMKYTGATPSDTPAACTFETSGVTIGQDIAQAQFTGVYNRTATAGKYILGIKDNRSIFGKGGADSYVNPFRAYLNLVVDENAPALRIIHKPGDATALPGIAQQEWSVCNGDAGELIIRTPEAMTGCLVAADGRIIRMLQLEAGEYIIGGLTPGVYIFNKKRVFIK
ncbi:MAG: chitobiase/beta-hexosaminidase C-terminal domain-containing protein [Bacteroidales bacterium]